MNRKLISTILAACAMATAWIAEASETRHMFDPNLEDFMVEVSAHKDSGLIALQDRITEIESTEGIFAPRLYGYLSELSRLKQANNQHEEAIDVSQRMQTLTHTIDGVHSPLQMEAITLQSRSRLALGQFVKANKLERFHLWLAEKNYSDADLIPALWRMADRQRASMQYRAAVRNYDRTLEIAEQHNLASVYAVRTLEARALAEHLARSCCANESLAQALENRKQSSFSDEVANQVAMLNLADLHTLYDKKKSEAADLYSQLGNVPVALLGPRSHSEYLYALDTTNNPIRKDPRTKVVTPPKPATPSLNLSFGPKKPQPTSASIGEPIRLCTNSVNVEGFADVTMTVTAAGKPTKLKIKGTGVPAHTRRYLRAVLLESRYRPEIKDGVAVEQQLEFRQYFDRTGPMSMQKVAGWRNILAEHACQLYAMR